MTDVAERLRAELDARGRAWTGHIEHLAVLGSTNDAARERARAGAPAWSVVLADAQTAGRGRQGRRWASPPGNLFLSVLLRPEPPSPQWTMLPLAAGVAVAEALAEQGLDAQLKWPNDVLVKGRKLGGILAEATSGADGLEFVVVGIGVNLAARPSDLPPEVAAAVTCVTDELGRAVDRVAVAAAVLARLAVWYDALARDGSRAVQAAWRTLALPWWGRAVEARSDGRRLRGIARDLDETGALILELEDGTRAALHSGEVHEVRPSGE
ncbi:MAG TPA: biotin--[acetyl-CoA-carboxylase] ligase [Vicinamibacteria bacterium]|nr:biotin--[acetyl-CoA-carboxylase] ligase [Vicinamibacteria bacterium]